MKYVVARFKEASTIRGFVWLLVAFGVQIDAAHIDDIIAAGAAIAGLLGALLPDK